MQNQIRTIRIVSLCVCCLCLWDSPARSQRVALGSDREYRMYVLRQIDSLLEQKYVLPDKATEFARSFHTLWSSGAFDSTGEPKEFAERVTARLRKITGDQHIFFRMVESSDLGEKPESALHHPVRYYRLRVKENTGFSRLEWLDGNIGLLELRRFNAFSEAKQKMVAAMTFLSNANAIILDLRENGGGSGDYLSSYFLTHPTQLTGWYSREDNYLTEFWTLGDVGTTRQTDVPLFVLTSQRTFSAAESFAYDMKVRKRAVLIGEPTKGGAHSVDLFKIGNQFEIYIPTERAVNPVTGGNWEGTGVMPDVAVPAATAFDTALILARKAGETFAQMKEAKLRRAIAEMELHLQRAQECYGKLESEAGTVALDSMFSVAKGSGFLTEFFVDVLAYNFTSKGQEPILHAILEKNTEFFPRSPTAYETLAYAFFRNCDKEQAIANYEKVLALDPVNRNAAAMIHRLRQK
jgi:hypothetical protein